MIFPVICVCQMLWVNPKPDVPVKAVRFANPEKNMCPVLIAMTAAIKQGKADIEAALAAQAKANEWLKKGIAAIDAGKDADARAALAEAIKADPKLDAAHQRLCELEERGHDDKAVLAAYKAWAATDPRTPLPYNKIGQILERQGDTRGAAGRLHPVAGNRMEPAADHRGQGQTGAAIEEMSLLAVLATDIAICRKSGIMRSNPAGIDYRKCCRINV